MKTNRQCPNCHQFKTMKQSGFLGLIGIMSLSFGVLLIWIPIIGIPLALAGLLFLFAGLVAKVGASNYQCLNCHNKWIHHEK